MTALFLGALSLVEIQTPFLGDGKYVTDVKFSSFWGSADMVNFIIPHCPVGKMQSRITFEESWYIQ